jgi:hypothetical protein
MSIGNTFFEYVQAFEVTFEDDDWSRLTRFFTADAVYLPGDGQEIRGRDNIFLHLKLSLDRFDRRFDRRLPRLVGDPVVEDDRVTFEWEARYVKEGLPDAILRGTERAVFSGDAISRLEDTLDAAAVDEAQSWIRQHGEASGISL